MKKLNKILFLLFAGFCSAQNYTANLQTVPKDGLTEIKVDPQLRSALRNNWDYFRILDSKKNEVPYVVKTQPISNSKDFVEDSKIISNTNIPNVSTTIIIANENATKLDALFLKIANTEVVKTYSVSGSNDQKQWFGLINSETIGDLKSDLSTEIEKKISFPLNNYRFLKIDFVDKKSLPIQVLSASVKKTVNSGNIPLVELKDFDQKITQDKQNKKTKIELSFKTNQVIDGLKFTIKEPQFYRRNAEIIALKKRIIKRKEINYNAVVSNFLLDSNTKNQFTIPELFEKKITIEIENQDSSPLEIAEIKLFQQPVSLISELKTSQNYTVIIDSTLTTPHYDLTYFDHNFQNSLPQINVMDLSEKVSNNKAIDAESFWKSSTFMWVCIGFALMVIAFFSKGLLKDLGKSN